MGNGFYFAGLVRSVVPPRARAALRRSSLVNTMLKLRYGGIHSARHPYSRFTIYYDGFKNLGWTTGTSASVEDDEINFVAKQFRDRQPACAWDVGANIGSWALFLAGIEPAIKEIVCFEPDGANRQILEMNIQKNGISNIRIEPVALSSHSGTAMFYADPMTGATGTLEANHSFISLWYKAQPVEITVPLKTVDELISAGATPPGFMKIDVEGHELSVLQGAIETLRTHRPLLMLEVTTHVAEVGKLLTDAGYELFDPGTGKQLTMPQFATAAVPKA